VDTRASGFKAIGSTSLVRMPIGTAAGISITDAANLRRELAEPVLQRIALEKAIDKNGLVSCLKNLAGDQDAAIVTVTDAAGL